MVRRSIAGGLGEHRGLDALHLSRYGTCDRLELLHSRSMQVAESPLPALVKILAACPVATVVIEPPGRITSANPAAHALLGPGLVQGAAARDILGVGWRELELVGSEGRGDLLWDLPRAPPGRRREGWRARPEALTDGAGEPGAVVVYLEEPVASPARGLRAVTFDDLFGTDLRTVAAKHAALKFAATRLPLLLLAETGTGKDLLARAIHQASPRRDRPFVAINCGALSPSLLESEIFGYAPGAFTDARREGQEGKIGAARGGTLFLDEVAEMPPPLQALLLRVLEDGTYFRVGDNVPRQADIRLVCATCRNLPRLVEDGAFRQDLYFRIAGAVLSLPPVRERSDVEALIHHVLERLGAELGGPPPRIDRAALNELGRRPWPGNVRQIKTTLQYALILADGGEIRPEHLPAASPQAALAPPAAAPERPGPTSLAEIEDDLIRRTLAEAGGNLTAAAKRLGIARSTLYRRLPGGR